MFKMAALFCKYVQRLLMLVLGDESCSFCQQPASNSCTKFYHCTHCKMVSSLFPSSPRAHLPWLGYTYWCLELHPSVVDIYMQVQISSYIIHPMPYNQLMLQITLLLECHKISGLKYFLFLAGRFTICMSSMTYCISQFYKKYVN
jgi:hypothetical protein